MIRQKDSNQDMRTALCGLLTEEMAADERRDLRILSHMVNHQLQGLGADAPVPIGPADPVPHKRLPFP